METTHYELRALRTIRLKRSDGTRTPIPNDIQPRHRQQQYFNATSYYDGCITYHNTVGNPNRRTDDAEPTKRQRIDICALFCIEKIHKNESSHDREADCRVGKYKQFHTTNTNLKEQATSSFRFQQHKKRMLGIPKGTLVFVLVHSTGFASDDTIADQTSLPRLPTGESHQAPLAPALSPFQETDASIFSEMTFKPLRIGSL